MLKSQWNFTNSVWTMDDGSPGKRAVKKAKEGGVVAGFVRISVQNSMGNSRRETGRTSCPPNCSGKICEKLASI